MERRPISTPPKSKVVSQAQSTRREIGSHPEISAWEQRAGEVVGDVEPPTRDLEHEIGHLCMIGEIDAAEAYARLGQPAPGQVGGVKAEPSHDGS